VIEWIRARATDVVRVNHDHAMATGEHCGCAPAYVEVPMLTRQLLRSTLTRVKLAYLGGLSASRVYDSQVTLGSLKIGEVAARVGVSRDTLRYYEKIGLLPRAVRTPSGYRQYSEAAVERVRLVRMAVRFGFSLAELATFLRVRDRGGAPCRTVRGAGERILATVEQQIADLSAMRDTVRDTLRLWDERLSSVPEGTAAGLLDSLHSVESHLPAPASRNYRRTASR
jgi:DNA-binding transcriptional MerR regulator